MEAACPTDLEPSTPALRAVVAATFAVDALAEPLRVWLELIVGGLHVDITWVGYGNALEALSEPASSLNANVGGVNVLLARLQDLCRGALAASENEEAAVETLANSIRHYCGFCRTPLIVVLPPHAPEVYLCEASALRLRAAHEQLAALLTSFPNVHIVGPEELRLRSSWMGDEYYCPFLERAAHVPFSAPMFSILSSAISRQMARAVAPLRKVLVLDCDGTLWGGAVGELGPDGVQLTPSYLTAQSFYVSLQQRGLLICLCSRNLESDVDAVFAMRGTEMPLKLADHVVGLRVNWLPKSQNVMSLARDLDLALDTFVFVDDNPAECADVQSNCPGVAIVHVPAQPEAIPEYLHNMWCFDEPLTSGSNVGKLTGEDASRSELYRSLLKRKEAQANASSSDAFLASLNLQVQIEPLTETTLERAAQLTHRTNQHNPRKCILSSLQLKDLIADGMAMLTVESGDRFGHHGIVGLIGMSRAAPQVCAEDTSIEHETIDELDQLTEPPDGGCLHIPIWLLSCRTLHIGIEHQMMQHVGGIASKQNLAWLAIDWVRATRNEPAAAFLFSLPGIKFLPGSPSPIVNVDASSTVICAKASSNSSQHLKNSKIDKLGVKADSPKALVSASSLEERIETLLHALSTSGRPLLFDELPSLEEMQIITADARSKLCKRLLPLAGKLPAPGKGTPSAVALLRGHVGGEQCKNDMRGQVCKLAHCPFYHTDSKVRALPSEPSSTGELKPSSHSPGVSVYRQRIRPSSGIIFVPVEAALSVEVTMETSTLHKAAETEALRPAEVERGTARPPRISSGATALHSDTYNYLARALSNTASDGGKSLHEWVVSRQRTSAVPDRFKVVMDRMRDESTSELTNSEVDQLHAKLRRELRHAQHVLLQESNPDSYYRDIEHHMS